MDEIQVTVPLPYLEKLIRESERARFTAGQNEVLTDRVNILWDSMLELKEIVTQKPEKKPAERRDMGKVHALMDAGWPQKKIAEEMGISVPVLNRWLEEEDAKRNEPPCGNMNGSKQK